jgi:hypothetical protein
MAASMAESTASDTLASNSAPLWSAESTRGAGIIVDFEDGLPEGAASGLLKFLIQVEAARWLGSAKQGLNLPPLIE